MPICIQRNSRNVLYSETVYPPTKIQRHISPDKQRQYIATITICTLHLPIIGCVYTMTITVQTQTHTHVIHIPYIRLTDWQFRLVSEPRTCLIASVHSQRQLVKRCRQLWG